MAEQESARPGPPVTGGVERHLQTFLLFAITALMGWFGLTVHSSAIAIAEMNTRMESLEARIAELGGLGKDRYDRLSREDERARARIRELEMDRKD